VLIESLRTEWEAALADGDRERPETPTGEREEGEREREASRERDRERSMSPWGASSGMATPPPASPRGTPNPFDKTLRAAVAARNRAKFEAVRAERNRLRADAAEAEIDTAKLRRRIAELETRLAQQPQMVQAPPAAPRVFRDAPGAGW
jgi:hypothetical protein